MPINGSCHEDGPGDHSPTHSLINSFTNRVDHICARSRSQHQHMLLPGAGRTDVQTGNCAGTRLDGEVWRSFSPRVPRVCSLRHRRETNLTWRLKLPGGDGRLTHHPVTTLLAPARPPVHALLQNPPWAPPRRAAHVTCPGQPCFGPDGRRNY